MIYRNYTNCHIIFCIALSFLLFDFLSCNSNVESKIGVIASSASVSSDVQNVNGEVWLDTQGNAIQTHDGILYYQGKYYWYGLDYSKNLINGGTGGFKAIKCYESEDLVNWTFKNNVLTSSSSIILNNCDINTVRVLYNPNTHKFVMWMGFNTSYRRGTSLSYWTLRSSHNKLFLNETLCATSNSPFGSFDVENSSFSVNGGAALTTLFQDNDGTAYCLDWANYNNSWRLYINKLSSDYLGIEKNVALLYPETYVGRTSIIHKGDFYYLFTASFVGELDGGANSSLGSSVNDGWLDYHFTYFDFYRNSSISTPVPYTGVRYAWSTSIEGPWSDLMTFGKNGETLNSYEFNDVIKVQGSEDVSYILTFNNWNTSDLSSSGYVWQPLSFKQSSTLFYEPYFEEYSKITIDAAKGTILAE